MTDFLLDPNVAYLFLIGGFAFALMAVLTPGTGLLEIGALFGLLIAGWGIYNLPINYWALIVLILGVFPFILALRKSGQLQYLGISIFALIIGSAFIFRGEVWWRPEVNLVLAAVTSLLVGGFFWIAASKTLEADNAPLKHDLGTLIGATGEAKTDIYHEGSVQVSGEMWTAHSRNPIQSGTMIRVVAREGLVLEVEKVN
ncbi:MAG: NfeD family protein [Chloroflexota bacterium]